MFARKLLRDGSDPNASNVIAAILATGASLSDAQKTIINSRIVNAKADGVWGQWVAYYGLMGGTAAAHAINWKSPGTFNVTWNGTTTHDALGVTGNGTDGWGDTGINPNAVLSIASLGLGFYSTANKAVTTSVDMGAFNPALTENVSLYIFTGLGLRFDILSGAIPTVANNGLKQYVSGNNIGTAAAAYRNGILVASATSSPWTLTSNTIGLMRANGFYSPLYSNGSYGSFGINNGLTSAQEAANYISELAFQTALGRN